LFPIEEERMASQKGGHAMIEDVIFPFPTIGENWVKTSFHFSKWTRHKAKHRL
jgi:hypothetical protein